jgi:hypothetical protein
MYNFTQHSDHQDNALISTSKAWLNGVNIWRKNEMISVMGLPITCNKRKMKIW